MLFRSVDMGFTFSDGRNVKIQLFMDCDTDLADDTKFAITYLNGLFCGFNLPNSAISQFDKGEPWDVVKDDGGIAGGHSTYGWAYDADNALWVSTWGKRQKVTPAFRKKYAMLFQVAIPVVLPGGVLDVDKMEMALVQASQ